MAKQKRIGFNQSNDKEEDVQLPEGDLSGIEVFINANFSAAADFHDSDFQMTTLEIIEHISAHFPFEINPADIYTLLNKKFKYDTIGDMNFVWLFKRI